MHEVCELQVLSLPKMSSEANAFEISEIQKDETESIASPNDQSNNVALKTDVIKFLRTTATSCAIIWSHTTIKWRPRLSPQ